MTDRTINPTTNPVWRESPATPLVPGWVHWWAILTVVLTFVLLLLGAEVTTKGVGMVDPDGQTHLREPWILPRQWMEGSLAERGLGYLIEHGHRFVGMLVGLATIGLAAGLWFTASRRWLRFLGPIALLAVIGQGLLGVYRVDLHALMGAKLAWLHGCAAQLVFALLIMIAVFTSPSWAMPTNVERRKAVGRVALLTLILVYGQLVIGGLVRHNIWWLAGRLHQLFAFVVVAAVVWLLRELGTHSPKSRVERFVGGLLVVLLVLQIGLGIESWLTRFPGQDLLASGQADPLLGRSSIVRSLHYVMGTLVFASVVVLTLWTQRRARQPQQTLQPTTVPAQSLEGVA